MNLQAQLSVHFAIGQEGRDFGVVGDRVGEGKSCRCRGRVSCKATELLGVFQVCFLNIKCSLYISALVKSIAPLADEKPQCCVQPR